MPFSISEGNFLHVYMKLFETRLYQHGMLRMILFPTLLPMARPKPHATAATSRSPTCVLRLFLTLKVQYIMDIKSQSYITCWLGRSGDIYIYIYIIRKTYIK